jgi:predicted MFS family arabinose efflux permease
MLLFLLHGLFFSNWVSRSPEVKDLLNLSTFQMGILATVMTVGAITGTYFGVALVSRLGARNIVRVTYLGLSASYLILGFSVTLGDLMVSSAMVFLIGFTSSVGGLSNNFEGSRLDYLSRRSILPSLHGMFSLGLLVGAGLGALFLSWQIPIAIQFAGMSIFVAAGGLLGAAGIPRSSGRPIRDDMSTSEIRQIPSRAEVRGVWRESRTVWIAFIGMSFVLAESAAATWLPIALVASGMSQADAALGFMFFAIAMTVGRFAGGFVMDVIGRVKTTALIASIACVGIIIVMSNGVLHAPYLGAFLWGLGCSLGFPIVVSALSDDQRMAPPRVNALVMTAQVSTLASGPALGGLGQVFGLLGAFAVPLTFLGVAAGVSRVTAPLRKSGKELDAAPTGVIDVSQVIAQREVDEL